MANRNPRRENLAPPVRTPEEARALAALRESGPRYGEPLVPKQIKIFERQQEALKRRGVDASKLVRKLLDQWLTNHPERP